MNVLSLRLKNRIAQSGPIPFRDFMESALYEPEHGYYFSGRAAIGRDGDFLTNVSVGPLFGRLLARQFVEMWDRLYRPTQFTIVEQGAHGGVFARDVLAALSDFAPDCFHSTRYVIVEPADPLRVRQEDALVHIAGGRLEWRASVAELEAFEGVHFSNELPDAFPVHRIRRTDGEWVERYVEWKDDRFHFTDGPLSSDALRKHVALLARNYPEGYETEVNLASGDWIASLAPKIRRGWVLLIDYGYPRDDYYRPERAAGTLSGYANHLRATDLLENPGEIDLTAHIDFTTLAECAEAAGLTPCGFTDQHHFMVGLSRLHFSDSEALTPAKQKELREFKTLMHPNMMGASFKALCLEKPNAPDPSPPLSGFAFASDARVALGMDRPPCA